MTVLNAGILSSQVKEFDVFDFPFLFDNAQEADAVTDGAFGKNLLTRLAEKNIIGLGYWDLGFRNLTNSKRPINKARGHRRAEDPRHPVADLHRPVQRARRQRDAARLPRAVPGARAEGGRRTGEPGHGDPLGEVRGSAEAPHVDAPHLQLAGADHQQEDLGRHECRREEDHHRLGRRSDQVPAPGIAFAGRQRARRPEEGRHAGHRNRRPPNWRASATRSSR